VRLSGIVLTRNEEDGIVKCLKKLSFCDEIIVIDDCSTDKTLEYARKIGVITYKRNLAGDFAGQRNFGLSKAGGDWVLFVDADEIVSNKLAQEIKKVTKNGEMDGYSVNRKDYWLKKSIKGGENGRIVLNRIVKKGKGKWVRRVHETLEIDGETEVLKNHLDHYPHTSVREFINHISFHSSLHAEENREEGKKSSLLKIISYPSGKLIKNFIKKKGFEDGTHGFVLAILMSFHSFIAWSKMYVVQYGNKN